MTDFERIINARIDDLYLRDIGFIPVNSSGNSGRCPIHFSSNNGKKSTFSFTEKNGKRIYTCWSDGCVRGADIIEVCRVKEHLATSIDAVRFLATRYGIELSSKQKKEFSEEEKKAYLEKQEKLKQKNRDLFKVSLAYSRAMKERNLDHALRLSFLQDKIKQDKFEEFANEDIERVNYSNYLANRGYEIDKYLSEHKSGMLNALLSANEGNIEALFAPTGSGKTWLLAYLLNNLKNLKALIILPLQSNVEQFAIDYEVEGIWGDKPVKKAFINRKSNVLVMTWDKAAQLAQNSDIDISDYILVADEIHQTYIDIFRNRAIGGFFRLCKKVKGRLDITATPNKLDFGIYDNITEYTQRVQTDYKVTLYNNTDIDKIIRIANKSKKFAILMNDTKTLDYITTKVNKKCTILYSDNKNENEVYNTIMNKGTIGDVEGLLNTSVIVAGVNIYDEGVTDIIVVNISDIATIRQYVARFRELSSVNVHIFKEFEKQAKTYLVETIIEEELAQAQSLAEHYTLLTKTKTTFNIVSNQVMKDSLKAVGLGGYVYFNEDTQKYEVNEFAIRSQAYHTYYNTRTIEQFKVLLEEYFDYIEIYDESKETEADKKISELYEKDRKEYNRNLIEKRMQALDFLAEHKEILVGYSDIINKDFKGIIDYIHAQSLTIHDIVNQYEKLQIRKIVTESKSLETITRYSNFVLKDGFTTDVAWILANMSNGKRGNFFKRLNTLCFRELKFNYDGVINEALVENQLFDFIVASLPLNTSYTQDHLEELIRDIKNTFGNNKEFTITKIGTILKNIYTIKEKRVLNKNLPQLEINFYKNITPNYGKSKQTRFYTIEKYLEIDDIKKELAVTSSDFSIEHYVSKLINSHLSKHELSTEDCKFIEVDFEDIF